ncbi:hypothetical protein TNCV_22831 [Trichonephila clavipes]|nr:hypothetical protein TNCV_22831 [Trichonephila clavipes]
MTRIPHHKNQFAHRQQYGRDGIVEMINLNTRIPYNRFKIQCILSTASITCPFLFSGRPCIRETNDCSKDQQFFDRMLQLSTPVKERKKIIHYFNLIEHENL